MSATENETAIDLKEQEDDHDAVDQPTNKAASIAKQHTTRFSMTVCFLLGSIWYYPNVSKNYDGPVAVWFFLAGALLFIITAFQDVYPLINKMIVMKNNSEVTEFQLDALANASLYLFAAIFLMVGSIYFLPDYYSRTDLAGVRFYVAGTLTISVAVLWDIYRLLVIGAKVVGTQILAMFGALIGANCFMKGALLYFPRYAPADEHTAELAASLFVCGSLFFMMHASLVIITAIQYTVIQVAPIPTPRGKDPCPRLGGETWRYCQDH
jgi:hypothetical protein